MKQIDIRSRNDAFQILASLKTNRHKRTKRGLIFVEGVSIINRMVQSGAEIQAVAYSASRPLSDWGRSVIDAAGPETVFRLDGDLMEELSDREEPSEIIVIGRRPSRGLMDSSADSGVPGGPVGGAGGPARDSAAGRLSCGAVPDLVVVLDRPAAPGNLGSAVRSCDAFGVDLVVVTGHAADVWDPRCLRASLGAVFSTPIVTEPSSNRLTSFFDALRAADARFTVIGTDSDGGVSIHDERVSVPLALLFGNEAVGLSESLSAAVDTVAAIPMRGSVDSLNLACAVSVAVYSVVSRAEGGGGEE